MPRTAALIARLPLIVVAYLAACVAAGLTLSLENVMARGLTTGSTGETTADAVVWGTLLYSMLVGIFASVPALMVIVVTEVCRLRSAAFHGVAGIVAAVWLFLLPFLIGMLPGRTIPARRRSEELTPETLKLLLILGVAGLVGGLVYWWIAGRSAGTWRDAPRLQGSAGAGGP